MVDGSVESGKSHPLLHRLYQLHCAIPNLVTFICRKKRVDMRKSIIDQWEQEVLPYAIGDPRSPCEAYGGMSPSQYTWKNGGVTYIFGVQEAQSMLGARFDAGYVCQAEQLTIEDWEFLAHRTGRAGNWLDGNGNPVGQIWGCCNPDAAHHWIPNRISDGKLARFSVGFKDNIMFFRDGKWTTHGTKRTKHLKETMTGLRYRRLIEGEWCSGEGLIFPEFDINTHVIKTLPQDILDWAIYQGIDYGASSPTVCVWIAHNHETDEMIVFKEWRKAETLVADHIEKIAENSEGMQITLRTSDHANELNYQLELAGMGSEPADKEGGSILRGLDLIRIRLRNGTLKFYQSMAIEDDPIIVERNDPLTIIEEMSLYRHIPVEKHVGDSTKDDLPAKGQSDHGIDGMRYVIDKIDRHMPLSMTPVIAELDTDNWERW